MIDRRSSSGKDFSIVMLPCSGKLTIFQRKKAISVYVRKQARGGSDGWAVKQLETGQKGKEAAAEGRRMEAQRSSWKEKNCGMHEGWMRAERRKGSSCAMRSRSCESYGGSESGHIRASASTALDWA